MSWVEIFAVFVVSHAAGDYLLQTDWQATNKHGGLTGPPEARRALFSHVFTYTLAFVPAGAWLAAKMSPLGLLALAGGIFVPHLIQDDARLLTSYIKRVKGIGAATTPTVFTPVDQSFHLITLFATALVVHAGIA